jgi:hypothetical protein
MLDFQEFFTACTGTWKTERIYHYPLASEVERSYTEFTANPLAFDRKYAICTAAMPLHSLAGEEAISLSPGFGISFNTVSETGEKVSMTLAALFVPDRAIVAPDLLPVDALAPALPGASLVPETAETVRGWYLRDEGYSESGAIAGKFTYLPSRSTLEMTTYYSRSVAVDQMRFVSPDLRVRTIVTYQRPGAGIVPTEINLIGFGMERRG